MAAESVAPDAPIDGDTSCIPLAELLAEVEAERARVTAAEDIPAESDSAEDRPAPDAPAPQTDDAPAQDTEDDTAHDLPDALEVSPEEADAILRELFSEVPASDADGNDASESVQ